MNRRPRNFILAILAPLLIGAGLYATTSPASAVAYGGYSDWKTISAGGSQTCAIRSTGQLYCWGTDGTGSALYPLSGYRDWTSVSVGTAHRCAIRGTGSLYCWGSDAYGQVGNGSAGTPSKPARIGSATNWKNVSAGATHTCGVRGTGILACWGSDVDGKLGNGSSGNTSVPVQVGSITTWKSVSAGGSHSCGIRGAGNLYCWGSDAAGQVGNGSAANTPVQSPKRISSAAWNSVSAGGSHSCAIRADGLLGCWGSDSSGQLGNGSGGNRTAPMRTTGINDWKRVSAGEKHTCAYRGAGTLYCWGSNDARQSVEGSSTMSFQGPQRYDGTYDWRVVEAGVRHTCAIRATARIYCWGAQRRPSTGTPAGTGYPASLSSLEYLKKWKLTTPVDLNNNGSPDEVRQPDLATYRNLTHFHTNSNNTAAVFRANAGGATTSGSRYPRSELREMKPYDGVEADEIWWSNRTGIHTLSMVAKITHLPEKKPHMVVAQIHDPKDEILLIRLDGTRLYTRVRYGVDNEQDVVFTNDYRLGTAFNITIEAKSSRIYVHYNDVLKANFSRANASSSTTLAGGKWYFKAGAYCQSSSTKNTGSYVGESPYAYAESVISQLTVTHT